MDSYPTPSDPPQLPTLHASHSNVPSPANSMSPVTPANYEDNSAKTVLSAGSKQCEYRRQHLPAKCRADRDGDLDMEPMTDAFLTAFVLAAVAIGTPLPGREPSGAPKNTARILGIANQGVKEFKGFRLRSTNLVW